MHPELLHLGGLSIKTYGFCLAVGFMLGTWLAMRWAKHFRADPEVVVTVTFLSVLCGVGGARLLYVLHYWEQFANRPNLFLSVIDIRQGGLEFLGGFVCATVAVLGYLFLSRRVPLTGSKRRVHSVLLYLDILTPSLMLGLAVTRIGCFSNGCCFGGVSVKPGTQDPQYAWALRFPFGSPIFARQWEDRETTVPAELVLATQQSPIPMLVDRLALAAPERQGSARWLNRPRQFPSRVDSSRRTSPEELKALAASLRSTPAHPAQLYASLDAFLIFLVLSGLLYVRRRPGVVFVTLFLLYAPMRFILEIIRVDNPHDTFGLTVSQFTSAAMFALGTVALIGLFRFVPKDALKATVPVAPNPVARTPKGPKRNRRRRSRS